MLVFCLVCSLNLVGQFETACGFDEQLDVEVMQRACGRQLLNFKELSDVLHARPVPTHYQDSSSRIQEPELCTANSRHSQVDHLI